MRFVIENKKNVSSAINFLLQLPPRSKAVTYTQDNWFYLISAAHNSSVRCLSNLPESILSLHINFPVTFFLFLFFPPPNLLFTQVSLPKLDMPHTFTYMNTGSVTPAAHAYGLRPLRAPQARTSQLNSPALSPPGLKPSRALSLPPGPGQLQLPLSCTPVLLSPHGIIHIMKEGEKEICTYIYIYISVCGRGLRMCSPLVRPRP